MGSKGTQNREVSQTGDSRPQNHRPQTADNTRQTSMLRFSLRSGVGEFGAPQEFSFEFRGFRQNSGPVPKGRLKALNQAGQQSDARDQGTHLDMLVPGMGSISGNAQTIQGGNSQGGGDIPVTSSTTFSLT